MDHHTRQQSECLLPDRKAGELAFRSRRHRWAFLFHIVLFLVNTGVTILFLARIYGQDTINTLSFTGQRLAVRPQRFMMTEDSPYAGPPSERVDEAWKKLLHHINIRVSHGEMQSTNQTSVPLADGNGFLAWMDVSHQLHCVKYLRQWIYRQHYHPDVGLDEEPHWLLHIDHCLDLIRQALMCRADTSIMTFNWVANRSEPMLKLDSPEHVCIDWEDLMRKVQDRRIDNAAMAQLVNPSLDSKFV
ncbi:hypothetical protein BU23DRAFT_72452 [Bimuria novae-zelandiae CBS 107.79]|uniref:Tat pathway signal sequence n=1 Tax=Bimuria novae-zelandiae CBS 107.79 TaxID=1447943 RepID=A0A6A5UG04_9PLEO|nr:hypothetical protein BU23DRAFT_93653 [Bimuria novae-zelandiae CBS 107.79]KAF1964123.1 hypothetical protein BU23DRAFT_72452 [Bimuria novae-zelandiae CBS 107.79]